jgi:hypothetical protein
MTSGTTTAFFLLSGRLACLTVKGIKLVEQRLESTSFDNSFESTLDIVNARQQNVHGNLG